MSRKRNKAKAPQPAVDVTLQHNSLLIMWWVLWVSNQKS